MKLNLINSKNAIIVRVSFTRVSSYISDVLFAFEIKSFL